ncbi:glycosyltransferase family 4 protein [Acinetobacter indicus]|uniref:glycosyltransferase family 4 protein n=1 Tax=Acinetobacter indicus TaxID=756892 RepID=UPI0014439BF8|nr:glycosyltransferase family 4 protein [Acinetobacter indicus]
MKKNIALIVATPLSFNVFYKNHINFLKEFYDVTLIANFNLDLCTIEGVKKIHIDIERKPNLVKDIKVLFQLIKIFKQQKFSLVHSTTPKAGLLTQIAARFVGVRVRLHTFTGQVWATKKGMKREILKCIDRIIGYLPTHLLTDSQSQKDVLENEKIVPRNKVEVLGLGSICGVDLTKFKPIDSVVKAQTRMEIGISKHDFLFLYLGRLNKEKGILDLIEAFQLVHEKFSKAKLLFVGKDEEGLIDFICKHPQFGSFILYKGFTNSPQNYMAMADVFCLPSYREGFGSVIIEAAACGTPSIGTNIYGLTDAIENGKSGLLCEVDNSQDLSEKMISFIENDTLRKECAEYGLQRVKDNFNTVLISQYLSEFYEKILKAEKC